jgi:beta-glucosidase
VLPEDPGFAEDAALQARRLIEHGDPVGAWQMRLSDASGEGYVSSGRGQSPSGALSVAPADHAVQGDTLIATWVAAATLYLDGPTTDLRPAEGEALALELQYQVLEADLSRASLVLGESALDVAGGLAALQGAGWHSSTIAVSCFGDHGAELAAVTHPLAIAADGALSLQIGSARLVTAAAAPGCGL